jgi:FKBP-type peptidyl-prolyl cis-trans isomerase
MNERQRIVSQGYAVLLGAPLLLAATTGWTSTESAPAAATPAATSPATAATGENAVAESYSLGLSFATQWRQAGLEGVVTPEDLIRGIRAGLAGTELTPQDKQRASALMRTAFESWAQRNKTQADEFLTHNASEPGVKTTASGLQYLVLKSAQPGSPTARDSDHVKVQFRGHLLSGYEFDSTYSRNTPAVVRPSDVIAGWREALEMMPAGAQWRLFIPPQLAYGTTPPPSIPPDSLLIFDVEVLGIQPAAAPTAHSAPAEAPRQ